MEEGRVLLFVPRIEQRQAVAALCFCCQQHDIESSSSLCNSGAAAAALAAAAQDAGQPNPLEGTS
jgi:hypothetical protein